MSETNAGKFYRPSILKVAQAIARVDGCTYASCSEDVRKAYDDMAVAALGAMSPRQRGDAPAPADRGLPKGRTAIAHLKRPGNLPTAWVLVDEPLTKEAMAASPHWVFRRCTIGAEERHKA